MDPTIARSIAHYSHLGGRTRFDEPMIEHVERVAAAVPEQARAVAFLHDVLEHTGTGVDDLRAEGATALELAALELLTRSPDDSYELHCLRIAFAPGQAGVLARQVKLADLDDHLGHGWLPQDAPPYQWARRHIRWAQERRAGARQAA